MNDREHSSKHSSLLGARVLVVGMGGLGCPAALALSHAGVGEIHVCDDDVVAESNLHRQILYRDEDVGRHKLEAAIERLSSEGARNVVAHPTRLLPENARALVRSMHVVIEGADNFATKFLAADACHLESVPIIHGAAVRFIGTALSVGADGGPCYRCVFEDLLPPAQSPNCQEAGVMGPVVGVVGALLADLALDVLLGDVRRQGTIFNYDGKSGAMRSVELEARSTCPLCGTEAKKIQNLSPELYGAAQASSASSLGSSSPAPN